LDASSDGLLRPRRRCPAVQRWAWWPETRKPP